MDLENRSEVEVCLGADYMITPGELAPTYLFLKWFGRLYLVSIGVAQLSIVRWVGTYSGSVKVPGQPKVSMEMT